MGEEGIDYKRDVPASWEPVNEMGKDQAEQQVEDLREALHYHDKKYYIEADPVISDAEYDRLLDRLQELENSFPDLDDPNSPTKRVGAPPVDEWETIEHIVPMLSLDSSLEEDEIKDFDRYLEDQLGHHDFTYWCEYKFDGFSVELVYEQGELVRGATRGDGYEGEDVTENLRTIPTIPLTMDEHSEHGLPDQLVLRGEVFMPLDEFTELNERRVEEGKDLFANPRNAAAGTVRQLDPSVVASRPLDIFVFDVLSVDGISFGTQEEIFDALPEWGFKVNDQNLHTEDIEDVIEFRHETTNVRDDLNFEIDGVVIKVNELNIREELGVRQANPRWAIAYKFEPRKEITTIEKIGIQVGRTGKLTPVAFLKPVDVGGVTISRASLHNYDLVEEKDIRDGDTVRVERAGDVIPYVTERVEKEEEDRSVPFEMPDECPVCGSEVVVEGAYHFCSGGVQCPAQRQGLLEHFVSRDAMDIEGLGEKEVRKLRENNLVETPADLYTLTEEDLLEAGLFKNETYLKLREESDSPNLAVALYALGLDEVGPETAIRLANTFNDVETLSGASNEDLLELFDNETYRALQQSNHPELAVALYVTDVDGIGPKTAIDLADEFEDVDLLINANEERLLEVEGIGKVSASTLYDQLSQDYVREQLLSYAKAPENAYAELIGSGYEVINEIDFDRLRELVENPQQARSKVGKSVHNLLREIEQSKHTTLDRFIYALGIHNVGSHMATILAQNYKTIRDLYDVSRDELKDIHEIGPEVATSIRDFFTDQDNRDMIERMLENGVEPEPLETDQSTVLED
ncbi:MAG: NAD-dependent DNA ligase LigA, partial [bacterium]